MLTTDDRLADVPPADRPSVVRWLGGNPRALHLFAVSLRYHSLEELVNINPETWEHPELSVSPELPQNIERQMLERILRKLDHDFQDALYLLCAFRKSFQNKAFEAFSFQKETLARFKTDLIDLFLMEQRSGRYALHPIVREIGLQKLLDSPERFRAAHETAARHYTRHFYAKEKNTHLGTLGGYFTEARYHLVHAGKQEELAGIARYFFDHLSASFNFVTPVPKEPELLHERIEMLASVLESPGPVGLECHLARLYCPRT